MTMQPGFRGFLTFSPDGLGQGKYASRSTDVNLFFEPNDEKPTNPGAQVPSHRIYVKNASGSLVQFGAAWKHPVKSGRRKDSGDFLFSITLQDEEMTKPVNLTAYQDYDEKDKKVPGKFQICWRPEKADAA